MSAPLDTPDFNKVCFVCYTNLVISEAAPNIQATGHCPNCHMVFITKRYTPSLDDANKSYDQLMQECCERRGVRYDPNWQTDTTPYFNDTEYEYKLPVKKY